MSIRQFNGTYLPADDRILFRFNTLEDHEYRFWFTRRVTQFILSATEHLIEKQLEKKYDQPVAKAMQEFKQDAVKLQANFSVDYQIATQYPIGEEPVLVIDVKCTIFKVEEVDVLSLDFVLVTNKNLNLKLTQHTLQTMCLLLKRLNDQAIWGVPSLPETPIVQQTPQPESGLSNQKIH
jgi:hypothetical protein